MNMKFVTTKLQCQKEIDKRNNVCDHCGRKIKPMRTVDNSGSPTHWAGCYHIDKPSNDAWGHFTIGVPKEIYKLAYKIILDDDLYLGMDKDRGSDFDYLFRCGVRKVCSILMRIERLKNKKDKPYYTKTQLRKNYNKNYKK